MRSAPQTEVTAIETVGYVALVRGNRAFRQLWLGQIISLLGDWFNLIASASLVAELTQSGLAVGGLFVVRMLAPFLMSPIAGVVADRYNRKRILVVTDVSRAVVVLFFLLVREPGHVWLLYVLTAVQLGISGFFFPTRNAILPDLVSDRELGAANALSSATWSVMLALGAALGGLVSGAWGTRPAFIIDSLTFVLSAFFIFQIAYETPEALAKADKTVAAALRQYVDGLRYLKQHGDILVITLLKASVALLVSSGFQVIQVSIAEQIFVIGHGGGISLGLMYAIVGVGTGIGPIIARQFTGDDNRRLRIGIGVGYGSAALGLLIVSFLSNFPLVLFGTLFRGIGNGLIWVFSTQLLLQLVPNRVRGRVFATEFAFFTLMSATGAVVTGSALDSGMGIDDVLRWMAALTLIPGLLWLLRLMLTNTLDVGVERKA
jgi:MFS family permease